MIEVDTGTGATRLDDDGLAALLRSAVTDDPDPGTLSLLADAGLASALGTLQDPVVALDLVVAGTSRLEHRAWVTGERAVLVLGVEPGLHQLLVLPPAHLAAALVRMTRLRPRRTGERRPRPCPREELGELVHLDPDVRGSALGRVGASLAWRLGVVWAGARREVTAVDGRDGLFLADPDADQVRPISNTTAYRIFSTVLPPTALTPEAE